MRSFIIYYLNQLVARMYITTALFVFRLVNVFTDSICAPRQSVRIDDTHTLVTFSRFRPLIAKRHVIRSNVTLDPPLDEMLPAQIVIILCCSLSVRAAAVAVRYLPAPFGTFIGQRVTPKSGQRPNIDDANKFRLRGVNAYGTVVMTR